MAGKCWSAGKDFLTSLIEREIMIAACEVASGTKTSDAVRVATIMDHGPEPLMATLCQSPLDQRHSVDALNLLIQGASCVLPGLFQGQVSLQESAVGDGGNGKKRQRQEGQGEGQEQEQERRRRQGQGSRQQVEWNSGQQTAQFQGFCSHCAKWAHKRAEWRTRLAQQKAEAHVELVFCGGDNPERSGRLCLSTAERIITSAIPNSQRSPVEKEHRIDVAGCARQTLSHHGTRHVNLTAWNTECEPDGGNTGTASRH